MLSWTSCTSSMPYFSMTKAVAPALRAARSLAWMPQANCQLEGLMISTGRPASSMTCSRTPCTWQRVCMVSQLLSGPSLLSSAPPTGFSMRTMSGVYSRIKSLNCFRREVRRRPPLALFGDGEIVPHFFGTSSSQYDQPLTFAAWSKERIFLTLRPPQCRSIPPTGRRTELRTCRGTHSATSGRTRAYLGVPQESSAS